MKTTLLLLLLLQTPTEEKTLIVYSQKPGTGCPWCDKQEQVSMHGDGQLKIVASYGPYPSFVSSVPTTYNPETGAHHAGFMTLAEQRVFAGLDKQPLATGAAAHTPMTEVTRVIQLLPKPQVGFVDFGCGYDARWCVAAAEHWGCRVTGIEIDHDRAVAARKRIRELGLDHLVIIVEGDAIQVPVEADVGVAYLYPELLAKLNPRLVKMRAFASYLHQPAGLPVVKNGDSYIYQRQLVQQQSAPYATWGGQYYTQPVCNSPNCAMCNAIRLQLRGR